jgi:DNA-binding response OmpR family regulator
MPRILVIDDQKDVRAMICIVLRVNRFDVVEAESASTGLARFAEASFDGVIVDIFLDDSNGFDVITTMRALVPDLPVVAVSGLTSFDGADREDEELANIVYLQKPFRPADLMRAVTESHAAMRDARQSGSAIAVAG